MFLLNQLVVQMPGKSGNRLEIPNTKETEFSLKRLLAYLIDLAIADPQAGSIKLMRLEMFSSC